MSPMTEWMLLLMCLMGSGFYSGMETGIVSVNRVRLRHLAKRRSTPALRLQAYLDHPDRMLATTLVGTNLCNTALTVIGSSLVVRMTGNLRIGNLLASFGITLLILVFGEYLPKAWFQSAPYTRSSRLVWMMTVSERVFQSISLPVIWVVRKLVPDPDHETDEDPNRLTRKDMQFLLSQESGATPDISAQRRRMLRGVFALADKTAKEVMIPRNRMMLIKNDTTFMEILELADKTSVKSFPVYSDAEKRFTGILKLSDLYPCVDQPPPDLRDFLRPPQYVDQDTPADDLLPRLRLTRQPMLLVRDDQDRVIGFVTTEVVLEEIVGPLYEE